MGFRVIMGDPLLSIITPVFNEAENLVAFSDALCGCLDSARLRWEWLAVDDGSTDDSRRVLEDIAAREPRLRVIVQDRNRGSHAAILRGLREAQGGFAVMLAADMQDPPEIILQLLDAQRFGAALAWAARTRPDDANFSSRFLSPAFYQIARWWTGLPVPRFGSDCFLADRRVLAEVATWSDGEPNMFFHLLSLPLPQCCVPHDRQPRVRGRSGWTLRRKIKFACESLIHWANASAWRRQLRQLLWRTGQSLAAPGAFRAIRGIAHEWLAAHPVEGKHLDVGCGAHSHLQALGLDPVGVDNDTARIALFRGLGFALSSTQLPFDDGAFGVAWSFGLLHHLDDKSLEQSLAEMQRVTKPGGWIIVFDGVPPVSAWRHPVASALRALDAGAHTRSEVELRAALARHGEWDCRRVTYSWNGLEALFCVHHKEPCQSPPMSSQPAFLTSL